MEDNKIIITISGADKPGIVAKITYVLAKYDVNIEDIKEALMQEHFVMVLHANISKSKYSFSKINEVLLATCEKLAIECFVSKKDISNERYMI